MKRIPIAAAKRIADEYGYEQVVIFARHPEMSPGLGNGGEYVTTYGTTLQHCEIAAAYIRWPEELCNSKPARVKRKERVLREAEEST